MILLEACPLFKNLTEPELARVRSAAREFTFAAEETIFKEGDPGNGLYIVKNGRVQISVVLNQAARVVLTRLNPGDLFGEMAVLDENPRSASATTETETILYFISREDLLLLLECIPRLSSFFVREMSQRLRDFNSRYVHETLQAERLSLLGRFASSIVHDLKNPLNIIGLASEIAGAETTSVALRRSARDRISKQVKRISGMLNELLEYARGSQPNMILVESDFASLVRSVVEELQPIADAKSVRLEFQNNPPALMLLINPPRLTRVFHNLIHNAIEMLPDGGTIFLRFTQEQTELVTEIEDSGPGIAPEIMDTLFEAFATHGKSHGTGLGLSICKRIVEDHRGRIYTRSEPRRGAILGFTLPLPPP
ncbi:MAG: ATP-binding protein [Verrucomicrobiota bacterium]